MFARSKRFSQPAFGRRQPFVLESAETTAVATPALSDDLKLFAVNFAGGFAFVLIYLA